MAGREFESDPRFAKLSYPEQQEIRVRLVGEQMTQDPRFAKLSPSERTAVMQQIASEPPVFENQKVAETVATAASNQGTALMQKLWSDFASSSIIVGGAIKFSDMVLKSLGRDNEGNPLSQEMSYGPDARKASAYLQSVISKDEPSSSPFENGLFHFVANLDGALAKMGGLVTDLSTVRGMAGTEVAPLFAASANRAAVAGKWLTQWALESLLPNLTSNAIAGFAGVARESALAAMNKDDITFQTLGKAFGSYAAGDTLFWNAVQFGGPFLSLSGRIIGSVFKGMRKSESVLYKLVEENGKLRKVALTKEEFSEYKKAFLRGDVPDDVVRSMSPAVQEIARGQKDAAFFRANPELARENPYGHSTLASASLGLTMFKDGKGYGFRDMTNPTGKIHVGTLAEVDDILQDRLSQVASKYGNNGMETLRQNELTRYLVDMHDRVSGIKTDLDSVAIRGSVAPSARSRVNPSELSALGRFSSDANAVSGTFSIPIPKEAMDKAVKDKTAFPRIADAVPLKKGEGAPNVFAVFKNVANENEATAAQAWAARAKSKGATESMDDLTATALRRQGYDGARLPDGNILSLYPREQIKLLDAKIDPRTGKAGFKPPAFKGTPRETLLDVPAIQKIVPNADVAKSNVMLNVLFAKTSDGAIDSARASRGASLLLQRMGSTDARVKVQVISDATEPILRKDVNGLRILLPETTKDVGNTVAKLLANHVASQPRVVAAMENIPTKTVQFPTNPQAEHNLGIWFANLLENDNGVKTWWAKNAIEGEKSQDAFRRMMLDEATSMELREEAKRFGVRIIETGNEAIAMKGGKKIASGQTAKEVMQNAGFVPEKISSRFAPSVVAISDDAVTFEVAGTTIRGNSKDVWPMLDAFRNDRDAVVNVVMPFGDGTIARNAQNNFDVQIPAFGMRKTFSSKAEAIKFVNGEYKTFDNLARNIEKKGGILRFENGQYVAYFGGEEHHAATVDELGKIMKDRLPDPAYMPELIGDDFDKYLTGGVVHADFDAVKPHYTAAPPTLDKGLGITNISHWWTPYTQWIEDALHKVPDPELEQGIGDMKIAQAVVNRENSIGDEILEKIFTYENGKKVRRQQREGIMKLNDIQPAEADRGRYLENVKAAFSLSDKDVRIAEELRSFLGETAHAEGTLFTKYGYNAYTFLNDFIPHFRKTLDSLSTKLDGLKDQTAETILASHFHGAENIPANIKWFSREMRSSDLISAALETDPLKLVSQYMHRGNLQLYGGEPWSRLHDLLNREGMNKTVRWRVTRWMDMLSGSYVPDGEKMLRGFMSSMKMKMGNEKGAVEALNHDVLRGYYSLAYTTYLSWRPYNAIKNYGQIFQTLGPIVGFDVLKEAQAFIAKDTKGEFLRFLRRKGVLSDVLPVVDDISTSEHILNKLQNSGLAMYSTADDLSRALAYKAGMIMHDRAIERFGTIGIENAKRFSRSSNLNMLGRMTENRVLQAALAGDLEVSRHLFANALQAKTMFLMTRAESPTITHSLVGKMFGQFGTFAANYVSFYKQVWRSSTPAQKAIFATRAVTTSAALAGSMYALGLEYKDWLPWSPMSFTGGPAFDLALNALNAIGDNYEARDARGKLDSQFSPINLMKLGRAGLGSLKNAVGLTPTTSEENAMADPLEFRYPRGVLGYHQFKAIRGISDAAREGDALKAFWALTGVPIRPE